MSGGERSSILYERHVSHCQIDVMFKKYVIKAESFRRKFLFLTFFRSNVIMGSNQSKYREGRRRWFCGHSHFSLKVQKTTNYLMPQTDTRCLWQQWISLGKISRSYGEAKFCLQICSIKYSTLRQSLKQCCRTCYSLFHEVWYSLQFFSSRSTVFNFQEVVAIWERRSSYLSAPTSFLQLTFCYHFCHQQS